MRFEVPQFIEVKSKIFGPLTFEQFGYLAGSGGLAYILARFFGSLGLILGIGAVILGLLLAFYNANGRNFIQILEAWLKFSVSGKLFLWDKQQVNSRPVVDRSEIRKAVEEKSEPESMVNARIKDIASSLDILDKRIDTVSRNPISSPLANPYTEKKKDINILDTEVSHEGQESLLDKNQNY